MSLYILDTDTLTLFRKGHPEVVANVAATPAAQLAVTIITVDEQLTGWYSQLRKATSPAKLAWAYQGLYEAVQALRTFAVLPLSLPAAHRYFGLRKQLPKVGKMDLAIAAIVLEENGILVTRNWSDFQQVPGLALADWSKP